MKYEVKITETKTRSCFVVVDADNGAEAEKVITERYYNGYYDSELQEDGILCRVLCK